MSVVEKVRYLSPDQYIEGEQYSHVRHEYVAGQLYARVGASRAHNRISLNLAAALGTRLRGSPCEVFIADVKVRVENAFFYPDVVVACDPSDAQVRIYRRIEDGWELETCTPGDALRLSSLQLEIDIGEIYEGVLTA